ncbi:MAG: Na(+)/H(+) antiporter subunit B [Deltaproteobacteria bacterium]|nr:Na(+)/H(+) antiporter subunit B [Deltaproteobacteria bacterium]
MKGIGLLIVTLTGVLLLYATKDFPPWGDPSSPASTHVSPYYLEKAMEETSVPNVVTAILADYRGFDTMFETTVIFGAGAACVILLRIFATRIKDRHYRHIPTGVTIHVLEGGRIPMDSGDFERIDTLWTPYDLIIRTVCRLLIPFIQIYALYVIAHGHHSPGGGFQGGVILGSSIILMAISMNLRTALMRLSELRDALLAAFGVFIYAGIGLLCLVLGGNFLDYGALSVLLPVDPVEARSLGILFVEIGVGIAVMATMVGIYNNLASAGRMDEGL